MVTTSLRTESLSHTWSSSASLWFSFHFLADLVFFLGCISFCPSVNKNLMPCTHANQFKLLFPPLYFKKSSHHCCTPEKWPMGDRVRHTPDEHLFLTDIHTHTHTQYCFLIFSEMRSSVEACSWVHTDRSRSSIPPTYPALIPQKVITKHSREKHHRWHLLVLYSLYSFH